MMEDILRACVLEFEGFWETHLPLIEFVFNNNYNTRIGMALFKALYRRPYRSPLCWAEVSDRKLLGPKMVWETNVKVAIVKEKMKSAQDRYKSYEDQHCKDKEFSVGDYVLLRLSPIGGVMRLGQKRGMLSPRHIGQLEILECVKKVA